MLLSSHDLAEVEALAHRIAIFAAGRVTALGTIGQLEAQVGARGLEASYRRFAEGLGAGSRVRAA